MASCVVEGCERPHVAKGFCSMHYQRAKDGHGPKEPPHNVRCIIYGCENRGTKRGGMCGKHAQRVRRYGDPHYRTPDVIRRANNRAAQPALRKLQRQTYPKLFGRHEHRRIAEQKIGRPLAKGEIVHHVDGNKHNNHPDNLQVMTQSEHIRLHQTQGDMPRD